MFDRFGIGFGAVLASQMEPQEKAEFALIGPWAVQDGFGIVLVRFFFRLGVRVRFFDPLGLLLGSFWGCLGVPLAPFWAVLASLGSVLGLSGGRFGAFNFFLFCFLFLLPLGWPRACQINDINSHQLINSSTLFPSTHQPYIVL